MSITTNKETKVRPVAADVKYSADALVLRNLRDLSTFSASCKLVGTFTDSPGEIDQKGCASVNIEDVKAEFTATEKTACKKVIAAFERLFCKKDAELADLTHDATDVFVDNT